MRFHILFVLVCGLTAISARAENYCLALRGNGELAPAHWGAMANLVEKIGMPRMQSGGSSATITMMLNEAIAAHPLLASPDGRARAALMFKSLEGVVDIMGESKTWRDFMMLYRRGTLLASEPWTLSLQEVLESLPQDRARLEELLASARESGWISQPAFAELWSALNQLRAENAGPAEVRRAQFLASEWLNGLRAFGAFDATRDANLFFRPSLIDFEKLAWQLGRLGSFYSGQTSPVAWRDFFDTCASAAAGLTWSELVVNKPECAVQFRTLFDAHFAQHSPNFSMREVGATIVTLPTTAVIVHRSAQQVADAFVEYRRRMDSEFGRDFALRETSDLRFGYWGAQILLDQIERQLPTADEKGRRFFALGPATWKTVLSLSPAEPGLAPLQPFGRGWYSAGGWSDLHPVRVLKAAGCENVVYVTRRGGESTFAEGVAGRLLGGDRGTLSDLYDLENPRSSIRVNLDDADAVLCTDWNRFDVKTQFRDLIKDSYRGSPFFVRNRAVFGGLLPQLNPRDTQPDGKPTYLGCY